MAKSNRERQAEWRVRRRTEQAELLKKKVEVEKLKKIFDIKAFGFRLTLTRL